MIPIVDFVPDKTQHLHDGLVSNINDNKHTTLDEVDVQVTRDQETKQNEQNKYYDDELTDNFSVRDWKSPSPPHKKQIIQDNTCSVSSDFIYRIKFELHKSITMATCTLSTINNDDIRRIFHNYVTRSLSYFKSYTEHNDWYIIPLISLLEK